MITLHIAADVLFVGTEITAQVGTAEFIVECSAAKRAFDHDLQGGSNPLRLAVLACIVLADSGNIAGILPSLQCIWQLQIGYGETGQASLRLGAAAGCSFIADLAAGAGGGARER